MELNQKIAFIGSGTMAETVISRMITREIINPNLINASGPRNERGEELKARYAINSFTNNRQAVESCGIIFLSVKPQVLMEVLNELSGVVGPETLVISVVAGASLELIQKLLGVSRVVRLMPNTPSQIGEGITVWTRSKAVSEDEIKIVESILKTMGEQIFVEDEYYLDMATALSGTGPSYVFMFMEAMIDAGVHLGFSRRVAEKLVVETVRGSVDYYKMKGDQFHLASMRNQVTSPGGTSAEALYYLEKAGFRTAISRAIWAAYIRSQELGKDKLSPPPERF